MMLTETKHVVELRQIDRIQPHHVELLKDSKSGEPVGYLISGVQDFTLLLWEVLHNNVLIGVCVGYFDRLADDRNELCIVAAKAATPHAGFIPIASGLLVKMAKTYAADSVRVHATNKGVSRMLDRIGWDEVERIHRKNL